MPSEKDFRRPLIGKYIDKYLKGVPGVSTEARYRMLTLINAMTTGLVAPSYRIESMHEAGSPHAQKIIIEREAVIKHKEKLALSIAGIDQRENVLS